MNYSDKGKINGKKTGKTKESKYDDELLLLKLPAIYYVIFF